MTALATRPVPVNVLVVVESIDLARLERAVERDLEVLDAMLPVIARLSRNLRTIRDRKLFKATHDNFTAYFRDRFGRDRSYAYRIIAVADVLDNLAVPDADGTGPPPMLPSVESQARPLVGLDAGQQRQAWSAAVAAADGKQPTAAHVKTAVGRVTGKTPATRPAAATRPPAAVEPGGKTSSQVLPPQAQRPADAAPAAPGANLLERYRPRRLDAVVGQPEVIGQLRSFVASPSPAAFILAGATGTGKTSTALALAAELGVDIRPEALGGLHTIAAGEQVADAVREAWRAIQLHPMGGSGWRVLVVNEADRMSESALHVWLEKLEAIPSKAVVVFTSNYPERLPRRLVDRCELLTFRSDAAALLDATQAHVDDVWHRETGGADAPRVEDLPGAIVDGELSIRAALQALNHLVRRARQEQPATTSNPDDGSDDARLAQIVNLWPTLPESMRAQLHALAHGANA